MQPVIGITTTFNRDDEDYLYVELIARAGGLPVVLPLVNSDEHVEQFTQLCDGILLSGGDDVDPARYGEEKRDYCGDIIRERDAMEKSLIKHALDCDMPVFGICRGSQILNVSLGGTLYQDLGNQLSGDCVLHDQEEPYCEPQHRVRLVAGSPLDNLLHRDGLMVNSLHHQAIKQLAPGLEAMAYADEGFVEAVTMPSHTFVRGVQWHPERMCVPEATEQVRRPQMAIIKEFISACETEHERRGRAV